MSFSTSSLVAALHSASVGVSLYGTSYNGVVAIDRSSYLDFVAETGSELVSRVSITVDCRNLAKYTLERPPQSHRVAFTCR